MLTIASNIYKQMIDHLWAVYPAEGCGFLSGQNNIATEIHLITNQHHSPTSFYMDPKEQLEALLDMEARQLTLYAVFDSHPDHPPYLSPADWQAAVDWPVVHLVVGLNNPASPQPKHVETKGFIFHDQEIHECPYKIV